MAFLRSGKSVEISGDSCIADPTMLKSRDFLNVDKV